MLSNTGISGRDLKGTPASKQAEGKGRRLALEIEKCVERTVVIQYSEVRHRDVHVLLFP